MGIGNVSRDGRMNKEELLRQLEETNNHDESMGIETPGLSEAERMARDAEPPKRRVDGNLVGTPRTRNLTSSQMEFTKLLITGKTQLEAYRVAYPNTQASDKVVKANAWKLSQDPRIQKLLQEHWGETVEALTDDTVAVKRYVLKQLLDLTKNAKQEGSKVKALELMGKTVGMFKLSEDREEDQVSAEQLKLELSRHLRLVKNIRPMKVIDAEPISLDGLNTATQ